MIAYRKDIDGLRAVAIIPVIVFHSGFELLPGGFVGVDIFFVISGYLITLILLKEIQAGDFSFIRFYERRARRILPALVVMMLACIPFAWSWMLASDLKDFFESLAAAAMSLSNVLFWRESDYFAQSTELKPLLHTWSLSVEEQFYILFPPFLLLIFRYFPRYLPVLILIFAGTSLLAAQMFVHSNSMAVFYLLPFRAWELLGGSLCAWIHIRFDRKQIGWAALVGMSLIAFSMLYFDKSTTFPGLSAAIPVVGTALVILFSGPNTLIGRVLSIPLFVGIGLISYSLYLWHQPIFAFSRHYAIGEPGHAVMLISILMSFACGWLSWKFIETPFRRGGHGTLVPTAKGIFAFSGAALFLLMGIGALGHVFNGFPNRYTPEQNAILSQGKWDRRCLYTRLDPMGETNDRCTFPPTGNASSKRIALIGDSVMSSLAPALIDMFTAKGYRVDQFTHSYCFLSKRYSYDNQDALPCAEFVDRVLGNLRSNDYSLIVQLSDYDQYLQGASYPIYDVVDHDRADPETVIQDVRSVAEPFKNKMVFIRLYPRSPDHVVNRMVRELRISGTISPQTYDEKATLTEVGARVDQMMDGFESISLSQAFCEDARCSYIWAGQPMISDVLHMSPMGAKHAALMLSTHLLDKITPE